MPLNPSSLTSDIIDALTAPLITSAIPAQKVATAISTFWSGGQSNLAGMVTNAPTVIPLIAPILTSLWSVPQPAMPPMCNQMADAIDAAFLTLIISGGTHGIGNIASALKPGLATELQSAFIMPSPSGAVTGQKIAMAIINYTASSQVFGTGVPPAFVPPVGPIT